MNPDGDLLRSEPASSKDAGSITQVAPVQRSPSTPSFHCPPREDCSWIPIQPRSRKPSQRRRLAPKPADESKSGVVIETRNLSKIYRDFWGRKKVHALKSLDIEVRKGEIFGSARPQRQRQIDHDQADSWVCCSPAAVGCWCLTRTPARRARTSGSATCRKNPTCTSS